MKDKGNKSTIGISTSVKPQTIMINYSTVPCVYPSHKGTTLTSQNQPTTHARAHGAQPSVLGNRDFDTIVIVLEPLRTNPICEMWMEIKYGM